MSLDTASATLRRALSRGIFRPDVPAAMFHDLSLVRARLAELHARFPPTALHAVAVKANPLVALLRVCVEGGAGLEAASIEEVHLALAAGCPPSRVVFDSPAKTEDEIAAALALGVHLNADNHDELARIAACLARSPSASVVGVRVNPLVGSGAIAATSVAARGSRFGIPIDDPALLQAYVRFPWLTAVHVHVGSQGCGLDLLTAGAARIAAFVAEASRAGAQVTTVDLGGGLPVAYREADRPPTLAEYVEALRTVAPSLFAPPIRLVTELGRAIHATAGWAASRVEYVKRVGDERLLVLHLGADLFLRWAYRPQDWHHDLAVLDAEGHPKDGPREPWSVAGPLCFAGDVLDRGVLLPAVAPGDFVVIRDTGAYTLGMWSRHCSRGLPPVIGHEGDRLVVLRARETPADVVAFWSAGAEG